MAKELGVEFAFPSTTVTIEQFPDKGNLLPKYNIDKERIDASIQKIVSDFSKNISRDTPTDNR